MVIQYDSLFVNDNIMTSPNTSHQPTISLVPLKNSTLVMYDPDSIKPSWLHYLVINIPNGDITKGDTIFSYNGPSPPPGTGTHHYIFEQLEQKYPIDTNIQDRSAFNINQFKEENNLVSRAKKQFIVKA